MQIIEKNGEALTPTLFIEIFHEAKKIAPPRFLSLRLNKVKYDEIQRFAEVPESIQMGQVLGNLGKKVTRISCIKPPMGVSDGILMVIDPEVEPDMLVFEIHGIPEYVIRGLSHDSSS